MLVDGQLVGPLAKLLARTLRLERRIRLECGISRTTVQQIRSSSFI
jgi:hypothetical protein